MIWNDWLLKKQIPYNKFILSSFKWDHNHDGRITHDWEGSTLCNQWGTLKFCVKKLKDGTEQCQCFLPIINYACSIMRDPSFMIMEWNKRWG